MAGSLFREEVIEARRRRWLGEVVLERPAWLSWLSALVLVAAVGIGALLATGEYTHRTRVTGQLVPSLGLSRVAAPMSGVLDRLTVQEGDRVLAGDVLARVLAPRATTGAQNALAAVEATVAQRRLAVTEGHASQRQRLDERSAGLAAQAALVETELVQLAAEHAARQRQAQMAEAALQRFRELQQRRYVSTLQVQQQEAQWLDLVAADLALARQRSVLERRRAELAQALRELPQERALVDASEARELAALDQEVHAARVLGEAVILAPVTGMVGTLEVHAGQAVQAGQGLMLLLPAASALEAQLLVPSRAMGHVRPGDEVWLRYAAFPHQKFGRQRGRVQRISRTAVPMADAALEPHYRVVVALERQAVVVRGREEALRPGLVVEADLMAERRRLWQWVIEPLQTLRAAVSDAGHE